MTTATVVVDIDSEAGQRPGAIEFRELDRKVRGIAFRCPCGCGYQSWLPVDRPDVDSWTWNGSRAAASLTPSILQSGLPCKWHGFLTYGEFRSC